MSKETFDLASNLEQAFNSIGTSMMSLNFASKLLAYVAVMHEGLNAGIAIAQRKFNIFGGEVPDYKGIICIRAFINELERKGDKTPWLKEIYDRYNLK